MLSILRLRQFSRRRVRTWIILLFEFGSNKSPLHIYGVNPNVRNKNTGFSFSCGAKNKTACCQLYILGFLHIDYTPYSQLFFLSQNEILVSCVLRKLRLIFLFESKKKCLLLLEGAVPLVAVRRGWLLHVLIEVVLPGTSGALGRTNGRYKVSD